MCDSIEIVFSAAVSTKDINLPLSFVAKEDQHRRTTDRKVSWENARSPLTGATNKIQAQVGNAVDASSGEYKTRVAGYKVSVNVPASTIGNNVVVQNRVFAASRIAYELLQYWLLEKGCDIDVIKVFPFINAEITSVTLTYLFRCDSNDDASSINNMLLHRGEVLHPHQANKSGVLAVGGTRNKTTYFKHRSYTISSYVKSGPTSKSFSEFSDDNVEITLYKIGRNLIRVEVKFTKEYLKKEYLCNPSAWKSSEENKNLHRIGLEIIRQYFRLDEGLRHRAPKANDLDVLNDTDESILQWHLNGNDVWQHQNMCGRDNKYFSALRLRILDRLRIDIAIPWAVQRTLSSRLSKVLAADNLYRPTADVKAHSFYGDNVSRVLRRLRERVREKREQLLQRNKPVLSPHVDEKKEPVDVGNEIPVAQKQVKRVLNIDVKVKRVSQLRRKQNGDS